MLLEYTKQCSSDVLLKFMLTSWQELLEKTICYIAARLADHYIQFN